MDSASFQIRHAVPADLAVLLPLIRQTFRDTYLPACPIEEVEQHIEQHFTPPRIGAELSDPDARILLASRDGVPAGYVLLRFGSTTTCETGPDPVELVRIYLDRTAIGSGLGAELMRRSLDEARSAGGRTIWLSVWDQNTRAIRFYEKWGFSRVGDHEFVFGGISYRDPVMARPLA